MMQWRLVPALALLCGLVACGSSPPVHYYTLEPVVVSATAPAQQTATLGVGDVRLPAYLDRLPIVQRNGAVLSFADAERWAEPLAEAVPRVLAVDLAAQLPDQRVVQQPWSRTNQPDRKLAVSVQRFECVGSRVELQVNWSVQDRDGSLLLSRSLQLSQACDACDTPAVAKAHSQLLAAFSAAVAEHLRALPRH